jgi:hypothetical protein
MFQSDAYRDNKLDVQRDANNKVTNGQLVKLQKMIEEKVKGVLAIPTIGYSKLFWNIDKNEIRLRSYLNSCIFIEQSQKKRQRDIGFGMTTNDFPSASGGTCASPPNPKRQCIEPASLACVPDPVQVFRPPDSETGSDGMDLTNV